MKQRSLLASVVGLSLGLYSSQALATDYTFTGTGEWFTSGANPNWSPAVTNGLTGNTLNTAGNTALIQGTVDYNGGGGAGDFQVGNGDLMTVDTGGSWTQAAATGNWIQVGGSGGTGTVLIQNGGTFNAAGGLLRLGENGGIGVVTVAPSAGAGGVELSNGVNAEMSAASTFNLQGGTNSLDQLTATGNVNVSGGTTTLTGLNTVASTNINISGGSLIDTGTANATVNLNSSATFLLSGNGLFKMTGTGEFQPGATGGTQGISGNASLDIAGLVAFQAGATQKFNIGGGSLTLRAPQSNNNSIFSNGGYFNFTANSTGSILFTNNASAETNIYTGSKIRYLDTAYTAANYMSVFLVTHPLGETLISLIPVSVPETSTWFTGVLALLALAWTRRRRIAASARNGA